MVLKKVVGVIMDPHMKTGILLLRSRGDVLIPSRRKMLRERQVVCCELAGTCIVPIDGGISQRLSPMKGAI